MTWGEGGAVNVYKVERLIERAIGHRATHVHQPHGKDTNRHRVEGQGGTDVTVLKKTHVDRREQQTLVLKPEAPTRSCAAQSCCSDSPIKTTLNL